MLIICVKEEDKPVLLLGRSSLSARKIRSSMAALRRRRTSSSSSVFLRRRTILSMIRMRHVIEEETESVGGDGEDRNVGTSTEKESKPILLLGMFVWITGTSTLALRRMYSLALRRRIILSMKSTT